MFHGEGEGVKTTIGVQKIVIEALPSLLQLQAYLYDGQHRFDCHCITAVIVAITTIVYMMTNIVSTKMVELPLQLLLQFQGHRANIVILMRNTY